MFLGFLVKSLLDAGQPDLVMRISVGYVIHGINMENQRSAIRIFHVDAFTAKPFSGNPACVCVLKKERDAEWMQKIASEMNLSETAFIFKDAHGYRLRWFTPLKEVRLCGHATLAGAHILFEQGYVKDGEKIVFNTISGAVSAIKGRGFIEMDFPRVPYKDATVPTGLKKAIGCKPLYVGKTMFDFLIELDSEDAVREIRPVFPLLRNIPARGFMVTALSRKKEFDFVSRFFAPSIGIDEDPVTGSAHLSLALFWRERLKKNEFIAFQASPRGGVVRVGVRGKRIALSGAAKTIVLGRLHEDI